MKSSKHQTYFEAKEKAKEAIDKGFADIQILFDSDTWYVFYCDYLGLEETV